MSTSTQLTKIEAYRGYIIEDICVNFPVLYGYTCVIFPILTHVYTSSTFWNTYMSSVPTMWGYGVATISRLLTIEGLFCRKLSLL